MSPRLRASVNTTLLLCVLGLLLLQGVSVRCGLLFEVSEGMYGLADGKETQKLVFRLVGLPA